MSKMCIVHTDRPLETINKRNDNYGVNRFKIMYAKCEVTNNRWPAQRANNSLESWIDDLTNKEYIIGIYLQKWHKICHKNASKSPWNEMNAFIVLYMLSNFDNVVILSFRFVSLRSMNSCCFILSFVSLFAHFLLIFFFISFYSC